VVEAIALFNSHSTETKWFQPLWDFPVCLTAHQSKFWHPVKRSVNAMHGSAFVYLGPNRKAFIREFATLGAVVGKIAE
jgi:hypothetical protein